VKLDAEARVEARRKRWSGLTRAAAGQPGVGPALEDRRRLLETIAALRRVAVAAEAALAESRAGQQAKRATDLVRALELAGYAQRSDAAYASV
jgi:hypothetical protein